MMIHKIKIVLLNIRFILNLTRFKDMYNMM